MVGRKHLISLVIVVGVALYFSNLFVILGEDQMRVNLKPLQEARTYTNTDTMTPRRDTHSTVHMDKTNKPSAKRAFNARNKTIVIYSREAKETAALGKSKYAIHKMKGFMDFPKREPVKKGIWSSRYRGTFGNTSGALSRSEVYLDRLIRQHVLQRKKRMLQVDRTPVVHVGFLKVHKAFSTILQTMFFRFGYQRNLTFVLPVRGHYFSKSTFNHERLAPTPKGRPYDILCNHGYFNFSLYSSILPRDSVYIAIVREPLRQFISSYNYYANQFKFKYLTIIPDHPVSNLIRYPEKYEESYPLSYTMNSMAKDFGFQGKHFRDFKTGSGASSAHAYLKTLDAIFDLVLVAEWLDESLILLRRLLNWSFKDILYVKQRIHSPDIHIDKDLMVIFKDRNRLDYLLYDHFLNIFKKKMDQAGHALREEAEYFKRIVIKVSTWCTDQYFGEYIVEKSKWNEEFVITTKDCFLMSKSEMDFINYLKERT